MKKRIIFLTISLLFLSQTMSFGGRFFNRSQQVHFQSFQHVQHQPVVFPTVNYFVGAPIRLQALVQQELQADPLYNEFQEFKRFQALQQKPLPLQQPASLVEQNCAKCHAGPSPKGEFSIDGAFTAIERDKAARMVILGKMPKSSQLSPSEKGDIIKEILLLGVE